MIIQCEKCDTKFNLDGNLLKESGSKVRCTICKHIFIAFPPKTDIGVEEASTEVLERTEVIGSEEMPKSEDKVSDFEQTLAGGIMEEEGIEPISFEDLSLLDSGIIEREEEEIADIEEAMSRAAEVEKRVVTENEMEREDEMQEEEEPAKSGPIIKKRRISGLWIAVFLIIFLLAGAVSALVIFKPDFIPWSFPTFQKQVPKEETFDMGNKRLSFKDLKGYFVNLENGEKLFVVSGSVVNNYPHQRSFIRIKSNILDSQGKAVKSKIAYAGNPIDDEELKSLPLEEVNKRLTNIKGKNNINVNILPNSGIPFMIVFSELPEDISEFTVEAVSSSLAQEQTT
ncbi:MAG TPA: DUF3426 domain-containing protein [Desulfatiglandales bacterium]|nr:DUF3426 domain-containing protein [Desulfatiglandales bacterium]